MGWSGGRVNPIDFQSQTQHLTASNIRFVFLSEEVICYFETVEIRLVLHILLSLIKDVHFQRETSPSAMYVCLFSSF